MIQKVYKLVSICPLHLLQVPCRCSVAEQILNRLAGTSLPPQKFIGNFADQEVGCESGIQEKLRHCLWVYANLKGSMYI